MTAKGSADVCWAWGRYRASVNASTASATPPTSSMTERHCAGGNWPPTMAAKPWMNSGPSISISRLGMPGNGFQPIHDSASQASWPAASRHRPAAKRPRTARSGAGAKRAERQASQAAAQKAQVHWRLSRTEAQRENGARAASVQAAATTRPLASRVRVAVVCCIPCVGICTWISCSHLGADSLPEAGRAGPEGSTMKESYGART